MGRAVTLAGAQPKGENVVDLPFQVETRCEKRAVHIAVVHTQAGHGDEAVVVVEGVLGVTAGGGLAHD